MEQIEKSNVIDYTQGSSYFNAGVKCTSDTWTTDISSSVELTPGSEWSTTGPLTKDGEPSFSQGYSTKGGRYTRTSVIRYDRGAPPTKGVPAWKNCDHLVIGRDPIAMANQPIPKLTLRARSVCELSPYAIYGSISDDIAKINTSFHVNVPLKSFYDAFDRNTWAVNNRNPTGVVPLSLADAMQLLSDDERKRFDQWRTTLLDRFKNITDLNRMVDQEQLFYSNIIQTVFPLGRLLNLRKVFQSSCKYLSAFRRRFGKRPFLTALTEIGKLDLVSRFVIETTISDVRDFMSSFDDVIKLFSVAHGANNREWTRLSVNDTIDSTLEKASYEPRISVLIPNSAAINGRNQSDPNVKIRWRNEMEWSSIYPNVINPLGNPTITTIKIANQTLDDPYWSPSLQEYWRTHAANGVWSPCYELSVSRRYQRWAKVRYKNLGSLSPLRVWMNRVGIYKPLSSAWDLIPFSFVLDYFFRVGDWIEGVSNFAQDLPYLRGQVIDAGPTWECVSWNFGPNVRPKWGLTHSGLEQASEGRAKLVLPNVAKAYSDAHGFHRHPIASMIESFRFGFLSDKELNSTKQRTLVELGLNLGDKSLSGRDRSLAEMRGAITSLKLKSRDWRTPNKALDTMSTDMFNDYLKRTLSQVTHALKKR